MMRVPRIWEWLPGLKIDCLWDISGREHMASIKETVFPLLAIETTSYLAKPERESALHPDRRHDVTTGRTDSDRDFSLSTAYRLGLVVAAIASNRICWLSDLMTFHNNKHRFFRNTNRRRKWRRSDKAFEVCSIQMILDCHAGMPA